MLGENYIIQGITAIDVNSMSVAKYGSQERPPGGKNHEKRQEKRKYQEVQDEKQLITKDQNITNRKECSIQEHMQFMIWVGKKNSSLLNH